MLVGYQGEPGAFSEEAAQVLVAGAEPVGYRTFDDLLDAVSSRRVDVGLLPVENTIYGSIARSYDLLWDHAEVAIVDETLHHVVQCLIGVDGSSVEDITEVRSHPVALEQCRSIFAQHPHWRAVIVDDTAGAVRDITVSQDIHIAAIAARGAASRYAAKLLLEGVQDNVDNYTRFFLIERGGKPKRGHERACVALQLAHKPGSLRDALDAFAGENLNLRSLVSRPSRNGKRFEYTFYCEVENATGETLERALARIHGETRVLGRY